MLRLSLWRESLSLGLTERREAAAIASARGEVARRKADVVEDMSVEQVLVLRMVNEKGVGIRKKSPMRSEVIFGS